MPASRRLRLSASLRAGFSSRASPESGHGPAPPADRPAWRGTGRCARIRRCRPPRSSPRSGRRRGSRTVLERMASEGMDVARLNFAHETPEYHADLVDRIRKAEEATGRQVAVMMDVPGPKLRIGPVAGGVTELGTGSRVVLTTDEIEGTSSRLPVSWGGLSEILDEGDVCYLADGAIRLRVDAVTDEDVVADVEVGGNPDLPAGDEPPERHGLAAGRVRGRSAPDRRGHRDGGRHAGAVLRPKGAGPRAGAPAPGRARLRPARSSPRSRSRRPRRTPRRSSTPPTG